ncbi:SDR family NAD(P)-dependent oxidoreductase [Celeribacter sp.]|uniref:SDR family NAD(P)-dependent oxidoreductase n=1 Tax=Celeribacter sp. TaxID=1890673 RepID=UPI003A8DB647
MNTAPNEGSRLTSPKYANHPSLDGAPVVVIGGASGIGVQIVRGLREQGVKVSFLDRYDARGAALAEATGAKFESYNLTDTAALKTAISRIKEKQGRTR